MPHDHILIDWEAAGLDKPSIARVDRVAKLPLNYVGSAGRIGKLSQADRAAISRLLKAKAKDALRARQAVPPVE